MPCQTTFPKDEHGHVLPSRAVVLLSPFSLLILLHVASFTHKFTSFVHLGDWHHHRKSPSPLSLLLPTHFCFYIHKPLHLQILTYSFSLPTGATLSPSPSHTPSLLLSSSLGLLGPLTFPPTHSDNSCPLGPSFGTVGQEICQGG